jgi:hypothetical protein
VSVIFDGTSTLGEALAVVLRFVEDDWTIERRLVRVQLLAKSLPGEEIARELISVLSTAYSKPIAGMYERWCINKWCCCTHFRYSLS